MTIVGFFIVAVLCGGVGWTFRALFADERDGRGGRMAVAVVAGMLALHLWLTLLQLLGLRWTPIVIAAIVLPAAGLWRLLPRPSPSVGSERWAWPEALAVLAVVVFAVAAWRLWALFPDLIFHWGIKGQRYALAGGVDWTFLARPWNWRSHPDYPNLLPELYAATALFGGGWRESTITAWSVLFFALLVLAARDGLARAGAAEEDRAVATAALAAGIAVFAMTHILAGAADWLPALAVVLAWPALVEPPSAKGDLRIALAGALAAASKIEGVPLMALLVGVSLARRLLWRRGADWLALLRTAALPGVVAGLWWVACKRHALFQPFDTGALDFGRWREVGTALGAVAVLPGTWFAFALLLAGLPLLIVPRGQRAFAAVVCGQLAICLYIYMSAPVDPAYSVKSSFARLAFHLWPAVAVACVVASERLVRQRESCDPSAP
jgi:hypothetical protein